MSGSLFYFKIVSKCSRKSIRAPSSVRKSLIVALDIVDRQVKKAPPPHPRGQVRGLKTNTRLSGEYNPSLHPREHMGGLKTNSRLSGENNPSLQPPPPRGARGGIEDYVCLKAYSMCH